MICHPHTKLRAARPDFRNFSNEEFVARDGE
jgi:hypothetical protein